ncbi:hypothetical protein AB0B28_08070 [Glycomyces sp. NPDC046736]|uniref:hypothetical protein n=1 Tax=Glycomyces sp. NPDC046736 TaxID=3155615 RepID=UPI0034005D01
MTFTLPDHIARQVTLYAERRGITPDQAAERLVSHGLTEIGAWWLGEDPTAFPYHVEQAEIGTDGDGERLMQPGWSLVQGAVSHAEAREILAETAGIDLDAVATLPLRMPTRGPKPFSTTVYRIVKIA